MSYSDIYQLELNKVCDMLFDQIKENSLNEPKKVFSSLVRNSLYITDYAKHLLEIYTNKITGEVNWRHIRNGVQYYRAGELFTTYIPMSSKEMFNFIYHRMVDRLLLDLAINGNRLKFAKDFIKENSVKIKRTALSFLKNWLAGNIGFSGLRGLCRVENKKFYLNGYIYPVSLSVPRLENLAYDYAKMYRGYYPKEYKNYLPERFKGIFS